MFRTCRKSSPRTSVRTEREVLDILSCNVLPSLSTNIVYKYGAKTAQTDQNDLFVSATFVAPIRVDIYDDEGSNIALDDYSAFQEVASDVPGVMVSDTSDYLESFLERESYVEAHSGQSLRHYVIYSYTAGVIHILSNNSPSLEIM